MIKAGQSVTWLLKFFFLLFLMIFITQPLGAAEWRIEPVFSWQGVYDDNILFRNESDFENRFSPGIRLNRSTERSNADLSGLVHIIRYVQNSEFDRENQDYRLNARYAASPRTSLSLASRLAIDYTFDEFWEEEGIVTEKSRRDSFDISPGLRLALDEQSSLQFNFFYNVVDYSRDANPDYDVLGAGLTWSRFFMDGRTELFTLADFQRSVYDLSAAFDASGAESEQRVYRLMVGARHRMTETLDLSLQIGPMWTESRADVPVKIREDDLTYALLGSLDWRRERSRLHLGADRSETQSIYGENLIRKRVTARMTHELNPRLRTMISGAYTQSETDGFVRKREWESVDLRSELIYALRQNMDLSLGYNYRRSKNKITSSTDTGNRIYVMYSVSFPRIL